MKKAKQRALFGLSIVALFFRPFLCWAQAGPDPKIIEGAKKEREVVWYTTTNLETSKVLADVFQKKHPYINISFYRATVGPLINRVLLEARSGKYDWDVLSGGGEMFSPVMERGLIAQYRSPETRMIDDDLVDKQGYWTAYTVGTFVLGFNKKLVREQDVPKSYEALLDAKWKGQKIAIDTSAGILHALLPLWGKEKAVSYFRQLAAQNPVVKESTSIIAQLLNAGEMPLAISLAHLYELNLRKGAPIDWVPLEPAVVRVIPMMLGAKARHPNAAKLLYDFLVGKEGQEIIRSFNRPSVRKDVLPDPPRLIQGYKRVTMYPELYKNLAETQKIYNELFNLR
ncbi:MAG TPA: extracellular solute-binding protein [Candidatus Binatia bacterium]|jgi:iron(III) transport system substrate-binding protein|nr:extracellular solute-binding protein [Candidatus Binatia bacterium]